MHTYETKDFALSAYLVTKGLALQAHERHLNVSTFMFADTQLLKELVSQYYSFQATVNPIAYATAFRNLKSIMYSTTTTANDNMYNNRATK